MSILSTLQFGQNQLLYRKQRRPNPDICFCRCRVELESLLKKIDSISTGS